MAFDVVKIEALRQAALSRLIAAAAAANADNSMPPRPLKGLTVPAHRFVKLEVKDAPFVHVVGKSDGGAGVGHGNPIVDAAGALHINLLCACGRDNAVDLDCQAALLTEAICLLLLEDSSFLQLFGWLEALRITFEDARSEDGEYDVVLVGIEFEMTTGPVQFEPRLPDDATDFNQATVSAALGDDDESIPAQSLVVKETFPVTE